MNALERMQAQHEKATKVIEKLGLKEVYKISFTSYNTEILTTVDDLSKVEGVKKTFSNTHVHLDVVIDGIDVGACKEIKKEGY